MNHDGIAIIGMSGRFPGARDVDGFWSNIKAGVESITHFTQRDLEIPAPAATDDPNARFVCAKGILDDIDMFDARFFGCLPREAELMDPQHRVFLELCSQAIEHAGYDAHRYPGSIGVFGGCYMDTYLMWNLCSDPRFLARLVDSIQVGSLQTELGNDKDYLATRVAFKLGLRGPAMTLQTACSTSLVAIATACQSIASYQCDMALAGGVTIVLPQHKGYYYKEGGMLSPDGHCRTFDADAAGTVFSNGAAVVLLKRLDAAMADRDRIHAVIRGYAINNDGGAKVSYTAPSVEGQADVISMALAMSDVDARTIGYVEAHGTATPIGDPIEVSGLTTAFRADTADTGFCAIGSVKANLGHLDVASGAIGLIKATMAVREGVLPPSINFNRPNQKIDFASSPFYVNTQLQPWPAAEWPRRAGVSSFGVGGTNAHVIIEEAPPPAPVGPARPFSLLLLSARSDAALSQQAERLATYLDAHPKAPLDDVAYTLQVGRQQFEHRRFVVAADAHEAVTQLRVTGASSEVSRLRHSAPRVVFQFPGQGSQYPGMARDLYAAEPVFREVIDRCCNALDGVSDNRQNPRQYLLWDALKSPLERARAADEMAQTEVAQPALFAMEMALARLLQSWGIQPAVVLGHSVGEFAAGCVAGIFELEHAMRLVALRGRLMQAQPGGRMLAVRAPAAAVEAVLPVNVVIAAFNAPELIVVSGPADSIDALAATLAEQGVATSPLVTSHAFHSPMMAPVRETVVAAVAKVPRSPATVPMVATALARLGADGDLSDPDYWGLQLVSPVRYADSLQVAAPDEHRLLLEVGPGQALTTLARQTLGREQGSRIVPCLGPALSSVPEMAALLTAIGRAWLAGAAPDWTAFQAGHRQRVELPTYPFEHKRFWVEPTQLEMGSDREDADAARRVSAQVDSDDRPTACDAPANAVEQLIQQQLLLISEQIKALAGDHGDGPVR